jgi:uncharacterized protein YecE (DUF72 family)
MFYCGTSGFSYTDWSGIFYPSGLPRKNWLSYYSQEFNALELNTTYYALPTISTIESMIKKTGEGFLFAVKANQSMTHEREQNDHVFSEFIKILKPFSNAGKLGCVLAQFPYSYGYNGANIEYLKRFHSSMEDASLVIEFRNSSWLNPNALNWMRINNVGFCCVDEPKLSQLMPPIAESTSDIGYIRFHGRNSDKWWNPEHPWERYDYSYKTEEIEEWIPKISSISKNVRNTFIFANNHWRSQAVDTIRQVRSMLDQLVL